MSDTDLVKLARELLRRRNVEQSDYYDRDLKASFAEVSFLARYGRVPSINDIMADGRRLSFIPADDDGRTMRIVLANRWPVRIYARWLDVDNFIFARCGSINNCELLGWLPAWQVEEAPIEWFEKDGKRSDYSHNIVGPECLVQLPDTFSFVEDCEHDGNAIWSYATLGWECIRCGRHGIDSDERERIAGFDSQPGDSGEISADQEGS